MYVLTCQIIVVSTGLTLLISGHINDTFVAENTGVHPSLSCHIMTSFIGRSAVECGAKCHTSGCTNFRFDRPSRICFLYDGFMTYSSPVNDRFYTIPEAQDAAAAVCPNPRTYNSSIINVALGKNVTMSSQYSVTNTPGRNLVDGSLMNGWGQCAETNIENNPYMIVDLGQSYNIYSIYILNRKTHETWLNHVRVLVGETLDALQDVFYQEEAIGCDLSICLPTLISARHVKLTIEINMYLDVCELGVNAFV